MRRYVHQPLRRHFHDERQMVFLSGPRQVGKTTVAKSLCDAFEDSRYLSWDDRSRRELILAGPSAVAREIGLDRLKGDRPLCAFDELHKYQHWRDFLKGLFDVYEDRVRVLVTGSASLATFRRGGDSLMGRYFPYTLHPVSVAERSGTGGRGLLRKKPARIADEEWDALWLFGGFPEPFLKSNQRFYNRWRTRRTEQLLREDLRDQTRIQGLDQVEALAGILRSQVGRLTSYSYLAKNVRVSVDTVRRWIATLESLYYCFTVKPWYRNVTRALRKEPRYYLWDWSQVDDTGARAENLVASALLKAVDWWTESGEGTFGLHFIRDKQKREVDFVVTRENEAWFLVEVKTSQQADLSDALGYFQKQTGAEHAFQLAIDAAFVGRDCFEHRTPIIVPARTFLAQLV